MREIDRRVLRAGGEQDHRAAIDQRGAGGDRAKALDLPFPGNRRRPGRQFGVAGYRRIVGIIERDIFLHPTMDRLPDQQRIVAIGIVGQVLGAIHAARFQIIGQHPLREIEPEPRIGGHLLAAGDGSGKDPVDRPTFGDQAGRGLIIDEHRAFKMRHQQRPQRMQFGKMAAGRYRHRLDHQMGVGQMGEQFVPVAVGDLDGQLGNVPAPLLVRPDRGGEDRVRVRILLALDRHWYQAGPIRRNCEQRDRAIGIFGLPVVRAGYQHR